MNHRDFKSAQGPILLMGVLMAFLLIGTVPLAEGSRWRAPAPVFPPQSHPYGRTYGEWSGIYWPFVFTSPTTWGDCTLGEDDPVLFLQSITGGSGEFSCTAPEGSSFLFPVVTVFFGCPVDCGPGGAAPNGTVEELRAAAAAAIEVVDVVECEVDGVPLENAFAFRAQSPVFSATVAPDNLFGLPPGILDPIVAEGFWIMVRPLPVGEHVIHFYALAEEVPFEVDVTHNITVGIPSNRAGDSTPVEGTTWGAIKASYR